MATLEIGQAHGVQALAAVLVPDGRVLLASGDYEGTLRLSDPGTGHTVAAVKTGHTYGIRAVAALRLSTHIDWSAGEPSPM